jgi:hypothetical protein
MRQPIHCRDVRNFFDSHLIQQKEVLIAAHGQNFEMALRLYGVDELISLIGWTLRLKQVAHNTPQ